MNIVMTLEMAAECHPDRVAVRFGDLSLSYAQWLRAAKRAAGAVRASGCAHLALLDVNSPAASVALYAAAYAGVPFVPLNYRLTKPEIANGASELMVAVFGEAGRHARAAVGSIALPLGAPVEVEFLFEVTAGECP